MQPDLNDISEFFNAVMLIKVHLKFSVFLPKNPELRFKLKIDYCCWVFPFGGVVTWFYLFNELYGLVSISKKSK